MRVIVYISVLFFSAVIATSCINSKANADAEVGNDKMSQLTGLVGRYVGDLPCADCSAISTTLVLSDNKTYVLNYSYVGKSDELFEKKGTWRVVDDVLQLDSEDYNYKIVGNKLNQLDLSGKEITGNLAGKYMLNKVD